MKAFLWVLICLFAAGTASGASLAPAGNLYSTAVVAQAPSEVERLQKDLAKLGQDLSKAIAEGNKKAADAINSAIEKTKKKLKKAMESEQKDQTKNK